MKARSHFAPAISAEEQQRLDRVLADWGGTQRGKPRSRTPGRNPLGSRAFDLDCGWPMYRVPYNRGFRYTCGLYQQSHGGKCRHNHVDGPLATTFLLSCVRQRVLRPDLLERLRGRLSERAERGPAAAARESRRRAEASLAALDRQIEVVGRNLALAATPEQHRATARVFEDLTRERQALAGELAAMNAGAGEAVDPAARVASAMETVLRLQELAGDPDNYPAITELFGKLNARIFLRFADFPQGKRTLRKVAGGVVTFGAAPAPVDLYQGATARALIKYQAAERAALQGDPVSPEPSGTFPPAGEGTR